MTLSSFELKKSLAVLLIALSGASSVSAAGITYQFRGYSKGLIGPVKSLELAPASLDFPATDPHQSSIQDVTVSNTGTTKVVFTGISMVSGLTDFNQTNNCSTQLAAGANCTLSVMSTPSSAGPKSGSLVVASDAAGGPQLVDFTAYGNFLPGTLGTFSIVAKQFGAASFQLQPPSSDSTGAFTYESNNPAVATVAGDIVTIVGAGSTTITGTQVAAGDFTSTSTTAGLTVAPAVPTMGSFSVPAKVAGTAPFQLTAPSSNGAGLFSYASSNTGVATVSGNTVTVLAAGTTDITATQAAYGNYVERSASAVLSVTSYVTQGNLVWVPYPSTISWTAINSYCTGQGWRLPTTSELVALYTSGQAPVAFNSQKLLDSETWSSNPSGGGLHYSVYHATLTGVFYNTSPFLGVCVHAPG